MALLTASWAGFASDSNDPAPELPQTTLSLLPLVAPKATAEPKPLTAPTEQAKAEPTPDPAPVHSSNPSRTGEATEPTPEAQADDPAAVAPVTPEEPEVQPVPTTDTPVEVPASGGLLSGTTQVCTFAGRLLGAPDLACSALAPLTQD